MKKKDGVISLIIGLLIGIFFFIIAKNISLKIPFDKWLLIAGFPPLALFGMYAVSILGKRFLIFLQAGKFMLVGAFNTLLDLGVLNILILISGTATGVSYSFFKGVSFLIATVNSYFWNKHWTFEKGGKTFAPAEFTKFLITTTIGLFLNVGIASAVVNLIGPQFGITEKVWASIGALTATLIAWVWNFTASKFIVFKR